MLELLIYGLAPNVALAEEYSHSPSSSTTNPVSSGDAESITEYRYALAFVLIVNPVVLVAMPSEPIRISPMYNSLATNVIAENPVALLVIPNVINTIAASFSDIELFAVVTVTRV